MTETSLLNEKNGTILAVVEKPVESKKVNCSYVINTLISGFTYVNHNGVNCIPPSGIKIEAAAYIS